METTRRVYYAQLRARHDIKLLFAGTMTGGASNGGRPYYLLHYVTDGTGTVTADGERHELSAGDVFVHRPGMSMAYAPTQGDPWTYFWMGFDGAWASDCVDRLAPRKRRPFCRGEFDVELKDRFEDLIQSLSSKSMASMLQAEGILRSILSRMLIGFGRDTAAHRNTTPVMAVRQAQDFMLRHCAEPITIADVCSVTGYERTYFSNLFRQETGQTMQDYLSSVRINKACKLLTTTELTVDAIANRVGYAEYRSFSRCFKKQMNVSPQQYRRA